MGEESQDGPVDGGGPEGHLGSEEVDFSVSCFAVHQGAVFAGILLAVGAHRVDCLLGGGLEGRTMVARDGRSAVIEEAGLQVLAGFKTAEQFVRSGRAVTIQLADDIGGDRLDILPRHITSPGPQDKAQHECDGEKDHRGPEPEKDLEK